jgi:hypothetical protein
MKKVTSLALALLFGLGLYGCGATPAADDADVEAGEAMMDDMLEDGEAMMDDMEEDAAMMDDMEEAAE